MHQPLASAFHAKVEQRRRVGLIQRDAVDVARAEHGSLVSDNVETVEQWEYSRLVLPVTKSKATIEAVVPPGLMISLSSTTSGEEQNPHIGTVAPRCFTKSFFQMTSPLSSRTQ